jgi:hypothetical protein
MTVTASGRRLALGGAVAIIGGVVALAGALLPWERIDPVLAASTGTVSMPLGVEFYDGKIFVFLAWLAIVSSSVRLFGDALPAGIANLVTRLTGSGAGLSLLSGAIIATFALVNLKDIGGAVDLWNRAAPGSASVGVGLYLDLAAGLTMMVGGGIGVISGRR